MKVKPIARPGYVSLGRGMEVPQSFSLNLAAPTDGGLTVDMDFAAVEGRVACTRLEIRGSVESPVTASFVRLIRFDDLTRFATSQNAIMNSNAINLTGLEIEAIEEKWENTVSVAARRRASPDLAEVAQIWEMAGGGGAAAKDLMAIYNVGDSRAWRLIREARDAGHIPAEPLRKGRRGKTGDTT